MVRPNSVGKIDIGSYSELHADTPLCGCGLSLHTDISWIYNLAKILRNITKQVEKMRPILYGLTKWVGSPPSQLAAREGWGIDYIDNHCVSAILFHMMETVPLYR